MPTCLPLGLLRWSVFIARKNRARGHGGGLKKASNDEAAVAAADKKRRNSNRVERDKKKSDTNLADNQKRFCAYVRGSRLDWPNARSCVSLTAGRRQVGAKLP